MVCHYLRFRCLGVLPKLQRDYFPSLGWLVERCDSSSNAANHTAIFEAIFVVMIVILSLLQCAT